jgi:hypothetical protein
VSKAMADKYSEVGACEKKLVAASVVEGGGGT